MWGMRIIYVFFAIFVFVESTFHQYNLPVMSLPFLFFATALFISIAEFLMAAEVKSATPIKIFHDHLEVYRTAMEAVRGLKKQIQRDEIESIHVRRGSIRQNKKALRGYVTWRNAPGELVFVLKNNKRYKTGYKYPPQVDMMIRFFREQWGINVIDKGNGISEVFERDTDIRVNVQELIDNAYR